MTPKTDRGVDVLQPATPELLLPWVLLVPVLGLLLLLPSLLPGSVMPAAVPCPGKSRPHTTKCGLRAAARGWYTADRNLPTAVRVAKQIGENQKSLYGTVQTTIGVITGAACNRGLTSSLGQQVTHPVACRITRFLSPCPPNLHNDMADFAEGCASIEGLEVVETAGDACEDSSCLWVVLLCAAVLVCGVNTSAGALATYHSLLSASGRKPVLVEGLWTPTVNSCQPQHVIQMARPSRVVSIRLRTVLNSFYHLHTLEICNRCSTCCAQAVLPAAHVV